MAIRRVEIRLSSTGFDAAERAFEHLSLTIDKISAKVDELSLKLDKLGKKDVSPSVDIKGLTAANAELDKFILKLDALGRKDVNVDVGARSDMRRALADIVRLQGGGGGGAGAKDSGGGGSLLKSLISAAGWRAIFGGGGGGGAAGAAAAGGGGFSWLKFAGSPVGVGGIAALLGPVSALIDALTGFGIGSGVAAGGFAGVKKYDPSVLAPGMNNISQTLSTVFHAIGPSVGMMLVPLGKFVQANLVPIAKLFASSLPFMQAWINLLEQAAKVILPAFTSAMNTMVRTGALKYMMEGIAAVIKGIAAFVVAIGPGMKAGGETFRAVAIGIGGIIYGLGKAFGTLGNAAGHVYTAIHDWWDKLRHNTAVIFDGMRHEISHIWDVIFNNTVGLVSHMTQDISNQSHALWHNIASTYDSIRHDIESAWNTIWTNTVSAVRTGIDNVVGWFKKLPGMAIGALKGLGGQLLSLGKAALNDLWAGFKSVGNSILSWFKGIGNSILSALKSVFGIASPSKAMFEIGRNLGLGLEHGIQSRFGALRNVVRGMGGAVNGTAQHIALTLLPRFGWGANQWGPLNSVAMRESGWSMTARNKSSGAYGIAQFINGPSEYYQYGGNPNTAFGQVIAFMNYIRQRYGSPSAAWGHELAYGWYDQGGKLPPGLSLALNTTGHDEIHTSGPMGSGGDIHVHIHPPVTMSVDAVGREVHQVLRKYKLHMGNKPLGLD